MLLKAGVSKAKFSRLTVVRRTGVATAVVSNFDTRLRPLLGLLGLDHLFDTVVVRHALSAIACVLH